MKEVGTTNWFSPNTNATNTSLFTGLPSGTRYDDGSYHDIGTIGYWWSSQESDLANAWNRDLGNSSGSSFRGNFDIGNGFSVRCIKD